MLTAFGAAAVSLMVFAYAMEHRDRRYILLFAIGCALSSIYGFAVGAWPFGVVEALDRDRDPSIPRVAARPNAAIGRALTEQVCSDRTRLWRQYGLHAAPFPCPHSGVVMNRDAASSRMSASALICDRPDLISSNDRSRPPLERLTARWPSGRKDELMPRYLISFDDGSMNHIPEADGLR